MSILLYRKQYTHLKVLQLRYCGRDSTIQVRIDLIFIMVPYACIGTKVTFTIKGNNKLSNWMKTEPTT